MVDCKSDGIVWKRQLKNSFKNLTKTQGEDGGPLQFYLPLMTAFFKQGEREGVPIGEKKV